MAFKKLGGSLKGQWEQFGGRMRGLAGCLGSQPRVLHRGSIGPFSRRGQGAGMPKRGSLVARVRQFLDAGQGDCPESRGAIHALAARLDRFKSLFPEVGRRVDLSDGVQDLAVGVGVGQESTVSHCRESGVFPFARNSSRFSLVSWLRR